MSRGKKGCGALSSDVVNVIVQLPGSMLTGGANGLTSSATS